MENYFPDKKPNRKFNYQYDNNGNLLEDIWCNENNKIIVLKNYLYDEKNNVIKEKINIRNGITTYTYEYLYDQHHNWIKKTTLDKDKNIINIEKRIIEYYEK